MPTFINPDTGFPDETPCVGCGWPLYCCLCPADDIESDEAVEHIVAADSSKCAECGLDLDDPEHDPYAHMSR